LQVDPYGFNFRLDINFVLYLLSRNTVEGEQKEQDERNFWIHGNSFYDVVQDFQNGFVKKTAASFWPVSLLMTASRQICLKNAAIEP
ncbi:MAG: hypothetical protein D6816_18970, partial [Bacteroidetes bacterium]